MPRSGALVEQVADATGKVRHDAGGFERVIRRVGDRPSKPMVDCHRARFWTDEPDETNTARQVLVDFERDLTRMIVGREDLDREIRRAGPEAAWGLPGGTRSRSMNAMSGARTVSGLTAESLMAVR
jgi:hypothetical protein